MNPNDCCVFNDVLSACCCQPLLYDAATVTLTEGQTISFGVVLFSEFAATMPHCASVSLRLRRPGGNTLYASNPFRISERFADNASPPPFVLVVRRAASEEREVVRPATPEPPLAPTYL